LGNQYAFLFPSLDFPHPSGEIFMDNHDNEQNVTTRMVRRILAVLGIILIAVGEYLTIIPPVQDISGFPTYFWISVLGIVILLLSLFLRTGPAFDSRLARLKFSGTAFEIILAMLLCGLTFLSLVLIQRYGRQNYMPVTLTWFASGVVFILAFRNRSVTEFNLVDWFKEYRTEILLVSLAVILSAALRFYRLGDLPRVIDGDEGLIGLSAQLTVAGDLASPFSLWENFGSLYLQAVNWGFELFGVSPFTLRLLPAISGVLAIPALYLLARQISGPRIATIAVYLLATSHAHIHFSRIASVGYIHSTWLVPLELYLLLSGLEKRSSWRAAAGGVLLALHFRVYLTSQIIVGLVLVYMLIAFLFLRPWFKPVLRQGLAFWGGYLLMMVPQLRYILQNPDEFLNRLGVSGSFQTGWVQDTMASTGQSAFEVLGGRVLHAFLSLTYYPAIEFYGSTSPLLNIFSSILFLAGLGLILIRVKSPGYLLLNGYFWAPTLAIGIFALPPNADSYRMLAVLPPAFVIAAIGLDQFLEIAGFTWAAARRMYVTLAFAVILGVSVLSIWLYYDDFAGKCLYGGNLEARFASYLGVYAKTVDENSSIYLLSDDIFFYGSHASADFLSGGRSITNYDGPMDSYQVEYGETIIANPDRIPELLAWAEAHPGGKLITLSDCENVILVAYRIPEKSFEP
jgi:4-amino-4-deoxy-L-arabinose transferase-like glycosyltransferase